MRLLLSQEIIRGPSWNAFLVSKVHRPARVLAQRERRENFRHSLQCGLPRRLILCHTDPEVVRAQCAELVARVDDQTSAALQGTSNLVISGLDSRGVDVQVG